MEHDDETPPPLVHLPGGAVLVSDKQRKLHIVSEAIAVGVGVPLSLYAAANKNLPTAARVAFGIAAVGTAVVDGVLLSRFLRKRRRRTTVQESDEAPE